MYLLASEFVRQSTTECQRRLNHLPEQHEATTSQRVRIAKSDDARHIVFGWALIAKQKDGKYVVDSDGHWCEPEDVETAAYDFVLAAAEGPVSGEDHDGDYEPDAYLIESVAFTPEKLEAMGIAPGAVDLGHWIGLYVPDAEAYERIKSGERSMLSVEGSALETVDSVEPPGAYVKAA